MLQFSTAIAIYGLLNKKCELNLVIHWLDVKPDIIAITEIKPKKFTHQLLASEFYLDGYNVFFFVMVLSKTVEEDCYFILHLAMLSVVDMPETFHECLFLLLKTSNQGLVNKFYSVSYTIIIILVLIAH